MERYDVGLWKNVAVVEDVLELGGEEVAELMSSDSYIEGDIDETFEEGVAGSVDGIRQSAEGEVLERR